MDEKKEVKTEATADAKVEETPKTKIENDPIAFDVDVPTMFCNSYQLMEKIDAMFKAVFADYACCEIRVNNGADVNPDTISRSVLPGGLYVNLFFRENENDGFHVLHRRGTGDKSSMLSRLEHVWGSNNHRAYELDPDALEALEEFMPKRPNNQKVKWDSRYYENQANAQQNMLPYGYNAAQFIYGELVGFPIELILKKLFGDKDDNGDPVDYGCHIMRSTIDGRALVFQISKMSKASAEKLGSVVGMNQINIASNAPYFGYPNFR